MSRKQILYGIIIFFLIWIPSEMIYTKAHAASDIELDYNSSTHVLNVTISHSSSDTHTHYIDSVRININESTELFITYTSQPSTTTLTYNYSITATTGDLITVITTCSLTGTLSRTLTVGGGQSNPVVETSIPGYPGMMIFISASIFVTTLIIYKKINKK